MSQAFAARATEQQGDAVFSLRRWLPLPTILFMIVVTQAPLIVTLGFSLERWNLLRPARRKFLGLDNYPDVLSNPTFGTIIVNTLVITVSVVLATLVFGLLLALLLNRDFRGKGIVRTMLITPFLIMPTVSAVLWKNVLFNPAFGLLAALAAMFGFARPDMLQDLPMFSVVVVIVWQWTPFMMLILLAGLQSLDHDQIEACQIDGGGPLVLFRYIVLPHLQRYIELAVLMETLFILSVFGVIFVLTSGGPGIQTTNLSYGIYQEAFQRWDIGESSAMGIFAIILANIVVLVFVRVLRRGQAEGVTA